MTDQHASFVSGKKFFDNINFPRGLRRSGCFSVKEADLLFSCGAMIRELEQGKITASNAEHERMLAVIHGEVAPQSPIEKAWMKYLGIVGKPKNLVSLGLGASFSSEGDDPSLSGDG